MPGCFDVESSIKALRFGGMAPIPCQTTKTVSGSLRRGGMYPLAYAVGLPVRR